MIYKRDYYVSVGDDHVVITKNPNPHLTTLEDLKDLNKRYLYREGQRRAEDSNSFWHRNH